MYCAPIVHWMYLSDGSELLVRVVGGGVEVMAKWNTAPVKHNWDRKVEDKILPSKCWEAIGW